MLTESDVDGFVSGDIRDSMNVVRAELADTSAMIRTKTLALKDSIGVHRIDLTTLLASDTSATNEKITGFGIVGDSLYIKEGSMDTMKVKLPASGGGGFNHYIGEAFGGGVIFHLWKDAGGDEHGLIVATTDTSSSAAWSN